MEKEPIEVDPEGLPFGVVGCGECGNETACTGPTEPNNCPYCGEELWESDLPASVEKFVETI